MLGDELLAKRHLVSALLHVHAVLGVGLRLATVNCHCNTVVLQHAADYSP